MGKDPNEERRRTGKSRSFRRTSKESADWSSVDANVLRDAISSASVRGGAIRFGYTSDGGAYAIGVYGDGQPYTEFIKPSEDIEQFLRDLKDFFDDM